MAKILAVCASRDRNLALERMIQSFLATSKHADLAIYIDEDQREMYANIPHNPRVIWYFGERVGPVASLNRLVETLPGYDIYGAVTDDCEFRSPHWEKWAERHVGEICLLAPRLKGSKRMDFPWATKEWIEALGYFALPILEHCYWDVCLELLGEAVGAIHYATPLEWTMVHDDAIDPEIDRKIARDSKLAITWIALERPKDIIKLRTAIERAQAPQTA